MILCPLQAFTQPLRLARWTHRRYRHFNEPAISWWRISFSIDYSTDKHRSLTSSKSILRTYSRDQAHLLAASREVTREYIHLHRAWHRECINDRRPDPKLYEVGDRVFARRSILRYSGQITNAFNGPFLDQKYISDELSAEFDAFYINPDTYLWAPAASVFHTTPDPPAPLVFFRHVDIIYSARQPVTSNAKLQLYHFNVERKYVCTAFWTHLIKLQHLVSHRVTAPNKFNYITRAHNSKVTCESANHAYVHSIEFLQKISRLLVKS